MEMSTYRIRQNIELTFNKKKNIEKKPHQNNIEIILKCLYEILYAIADRKSIY